MDKWVRSQVESADPDIEIKSWIDSQPFILFAFFIRNLSFLAIFFIVNLIHIFPIYPTNWNNWNWILKRFTT